MWASPTYDPIAFQLKAQFFERQFDEQEFGALLNFLGDLKRFSPEVWLTSEQLFVQYPHFQQLYLNEPNLQAHVKQWYPRLQPYLQSPYPLPGGEVIQGPWQGNYKTANFPLCGINEHFVSGKRILDIGCNAGFDSFYLASLGASQVIGIEPSAFYFQALFLWSLYYCPNLSFLKTNWQSITPEALGTFDIINCQGVLYHEPSPVALLQALMNLLAPNGTLVLETHVTLEDEPKARFVEGDFWGDNNWWWITSVETTLGMLRACGYEQVQLRAQYPVPSRNPAHPDLTVEGIPVGGRAFFTATKPASHTVLKAL